MIRSGERRELSQDAALNSLEIGVPAQAKQGWISAHITDGSA
jgi:hypothetical protein